MGLGDAIMATAEARRVKGTRPEAQIVIGNGRDIQWSPVFENNPNITLPEEFDPSRAVWVRNHIGSRPYIDYERTTATHLAYKLDFRPERGDFFPTAKEKARGWELAKGSGFAVIEPNTKGTFSGNKDWRLDRWQAVADGLIKEGSRVLQLGPAGKPALRGVERVITPSFRWAWEILSRASLVITTDGGLHHAAAAVSVPAVVLWGARTHPSVLGYPQHRNLYTGTGESCGSIAFCPHCRDAMLKITPEMALEACRNLVAA